MRRLLARTVDRFLEFVADLPIGVVRNGVFERVGRLQQHGVERRGHARRVGLELRDLAADRTGGLLFLRRIQRDCLKRVVDRAQIAGDRVDQSARTVAFDDLVEGPELGLDAGAGHAGLRAHQ